MLTDSLIERELNEFHDSPDKKSNSTIHELNSKLDEVFKSSDMKIKSMNFNNDSTTLCSRKILGHQDKGRHFLYSSQQSKKLSEDGCLALIGSTTSVQLPLNSSQKGKSYFKKKKTKRGAFEMLERKLQPQLSYSKKKKPLQASLTKQFPTEKRTLAKPTKQTLLQKLFKHLINENMKAGLSGKVAGQQKEMVNTRMILAKRSLTEAGELMNSALKESKKQKHSKKGSLIAKRKSYDSSIHTFSQVNNLKLPFDKRRSEVSKSIEINNGHQKWRPARESLGHANKRKSSPLKQAPNDHSLVTFLQSSVQSIPENRDLLHSKLSKGKPSEVDLLDFQASRNSREFSNLERVERLFAKKKSEPVAASGKKKRIFDEKKKSVELGKPLYLSHKAVLDCITELNSNRRSFTKDCIKNLIQQKKSDQSATVFFRKKLAKAGSSKVKQRSQLEESQVGHPDKVACRQGIKYEMSRGLEKPSIEFGKTPYRKKSSKLSTDKSDGLGSQYSIQRVWQHGSKSTSKVPRDNTGGKSLKASFNKGAPCKEVIVLRKSKAIPYIVFDHSVKDILKYS